jgi:hypothetical protein
MIENRDTDRITKAILPRITADIKRCGQSVVFVGDGPASFYYTVGRAIRSLPELLLVAPLEPETGMRLLNALDKTMPAPLPSGSKVDLGGRYPLIVLDATDPAAKDEFTCIASAYFGEDDYRVQQVVMCDRKGHFPWDPACEARYARQRIFGLYAWQ